MEKINVYSVSELKEQFPEGFDKALEDWQQDQAACPFWSDEIVGSMKATFNQADISLNDWSIGAYDRCFVKFSMDEEGEYTGRKAVNWIKDNVLNASSVKRVTYSKKHGGKGWRYDITKNDGKPWSCELTGVCYDHDFIESLLEDVRTDSTLEEAFHNLADAAGRMIESEIEYQSSEEYFIEHAEANEYKYLSDGRMV